MRQHRLSGKSVFRMGCRYAVRSDERTTRSRNSEGYFFDLFIAPSSQDMEPPTNPGRFRHLVKVVYEAAHVGFSLQRVEVLTDLRINE